MKDFNIINQIKAYFIVSQDMEDEKETIRQITQGVTFRGPTLWVLVFAIFIASLGLNVNSTAVIIGAMLISPLMGPIIGMGLAVGINDISLLRTSAKNFAVATAISVLTATVYFLISPLSDASSELLARTSPTLYDVLIATCGGAAGIVALCTKGKGNVVPGVAIATALMPPLCTAGYGLATGHLLYFLGAFYLFFINTVFISLSTYIGVRLMGFERRKFMTQKAERKARRIIMVLVVVTILPAILMTYSIVSKSIIDNNISRFVHNELSQPGTQIISSSIDNGKSTLSLVAVGREINDSTARKAERMMAQYGLEKYTLNIIQGEQGDSLLKLNDKLSQITSTRRNDQDKLMEMSAKISELNKELDEYKRYESITPEIKGEMAILFPQVKTISLAKTTEAGRDSAAVRHFVA
ncbi:MAG: DUF389 domain-containing protein, partial [Bacteroidales bacterium]|nr:DUF389 domain-containing protein [Bacteroidales bacterium]MDY5448946.1 DUF389 domain-containing protein [Prevotella sp.]